MQRDFSNSTEQEHFNAQLNSASTNPAPLSATQFTRWLLALLVLSCSLLGAVLYLSLNGVPQTQAKLMAVYSGAQEEISGWLAEVNRPATPSAPSAPVVASQAGQEDAAPQGNSAATEPRVTAEASTNEAPVTKVDSQVGACSNNNGPLAQAHATVLQELVSMFNGVLGKMLAITMLLMGAAIAVVKQDPVPALTGAMGSGMLYMGPAVQVALFGC